MMSLPINERATGNMKFIETDKYICRYYYYLLLL